MQDKEKIKTQKLAWYHRNRESRLEYYQKNKKRIIVRNEQYNDSHRDEIRRWQTEHKKERYKNDPEFRERMKQINAKSRTKRYYQIMNEIKLLLGNKCNNPECPIPQEKMEIEALQIDHVKNDGNKDRKIRKKKCVYAYYRDVLKEIKAGSKKYQLLCAYCNWMKRYKNNEK